MRTALMGDVKHGGIRIIVVENKLYAAKASGIRRIVNVESITYRTLSSTSILQRITFLSLILLRQVSVS